MTISIIKDCYSTVLSYGFFSPSSPSYVHRLDSSRQSYIRQSIRKVAHVLGLSDIEKHNSSSFVLFPSLLFKVDSFFEEKVVKTDNGFVGGFGDKISCPPF